MLDSLDRDVLGHLLSQGRMTFHELAAAVRLSANATTDRVRSLERRGVITGYRAEVALAGLGFTITALIDVKLGVGTPPAEAERRLGDLVEVPEVMHVTGSPDYVLPVACKDLAELDRLISRLISEVGVQSTDSRVVLRTIAGGGAAARPRPARSPRPRGRAAMKVRSEPPVAKVRDQ